MTGTDVDTFSAQLGRELMSLNYQERNELLIKIGRAEQRMRMAGTERPAWKGPLPEQKILGTEVVIPTDQGERRGRVICFGVVNDGALYERSVIIHVSASGTQHEAAGSSVRLATPEDTERMREEVQMAQRLSQTVEQVQKGGGRVEERPRKRGQRDPELTKELIQVARSHPRVSSVDEGGANFKVSGKGGSRRLYVFKTQLRVDVSGWSPTHAGIRRISDDEARDMHLGKVRGQLLFDDRNVAIAAFRAALDELD